MLYHVIVVRVNNYVTLCIHHGNYMYLIFSETPSMTVLELTINQLLTNSLRHNTRKTYTSPQKRYLAFCREYAHITLPATEDVLLLLRCLSV